VILVSIFLHPVESLRLNLFKPVNTDFSSSSLAASTKQQYLKVCL
jgi:hypothetical protein